MQKKWQKAEKKDSKLFKTKQQGMSGRGDHYPTDSFSSTIAIDTKTTQKKSYSLTLNTWNKLCEETAILDAKDGNTRTPILSIYLGDQHLVVLSYEDYERLNEDAWKYKDLCD